MKTALKIFAIGLACVAFSCTNRSANSEDNNNESHLGTDIERQSTSQNDSLPPADAPQTPTDTAAPASEGNATQAAQSNTPDTKKP